MEKLNLKAVCLIVMLFTLSGCGVDWLPQYKRDPTTPDPFAFTSQGGIALTTDVTSNAITVSGITGDSSPIKITGDTWSNSRYSIAGATPTSAAGTVKNGDTVTVIQTSSSSLATVTKSTLSIGTVNADFTSTTQTVATPAFTVVTSSGGFLQTFATIVSADNVVPNTHVISIADSQNTGNAGFAVADTNGVFTAQFPTFTNLTQTVTVLNNMRLYVRNRPLTGNTTTLTIDGLKVVVTLQ
jgi:hypothetical protein